MMVPGVAPTHYDAWFWPGLFQCEPGVRASAERCRARPHATHVRGGRQYGRHHRLIRFGLSPPVEMDQMVVQQR